MREFTEESIIEGVKSRVMLNPPATTQKIARAEAALQVCFAPFYKRLYELFDGFAEVDEKSLFEFWRLEEIAGDRSYRCVKSGVRYFGIGDVMMDSYIILVALENDNLPIYYADSEDKVASNFSDFLVKFVRGDFDF